MVNKLWRRNPDGVHRRETPHGIYSVRLVPDKKGRRWWSIKDPKTHLVYCYATCRRAKAEAEALIKNR